MARRERREEDATGIDTLAVHGTGKRRGKPLVSPIVQAATFRADDAREAAANSVAVAPEQYYTRWGNPNAAELAETVAALERAEWGLALGSGMGAISATVIALAGKKGDHIVSQRSTYTATRELFTRLLGPYGVEVTFVDPRKEGAFADAVTHRTRVVYVETPGNPTMECADIAEAAAAAHDAGATLVTDNTFATPVNQRPIAYGADLVCHSATKYLSGHHDATGGVVVGKRALVERVWYAAKILGPALGPFDAWLIHRGVKTLPLRVRKANANAIALAEWLEGRPEIAAVAYPGLKSFPQHALAARQMEAFGGMVSFELKGGVAAGRRFVERVRVAEHAVSLGGTMTLVTHPASTTHAPWTPEERRAAGIPEGLIRCSVGIEDVGDLKKDFGNAMRR